MSRIKRSKNQNILIFFKYTEGGARGPRVGPAHGYPARPTLEWHGSSPHSLSPIDCPSLGWELSRLGRQLAILGAALLSVIAYRNAVPCRWKLRGHFNRQQHVVCLLCHFRPRYAPRQTHSPSVPFQSTRSSFLCISPPPPSLCLSSTCHALLPFPVAPGTRHRDLASHTALMVGIRPS